MVERWVARLPLVFADLPHTKVAQTGSMKVLKRPAAHPKKGKARERNKQLAKQYMRTNPIPPLYHPNPKIVFGFVCVWSLYCIGKCLYLDFASQLHFTMEHYEKVSKWAFAK